MVYMLTALPSDIYLLPDYIGDTRKGCFSQMEMITKALELLGKFGYARRVKKGAKAVGRDSPRSLIAEVEKTIESDALLRTMASVGCWFVRVILRLCRLQLARNEVWRKI
jgi:hypothetical protein